MIDFPDGGIVVPRNADDEQWLGELTEKHPSTQLKPDVHPHVFKLTDQNHVFERILEVHVKSYDMAECRVLAPEADLTPALNDYRTPSDKRFLRKQIDGAKIDQHNGILGINDGIFGLDGHNLLMVIFESRLKRTNK